MHLSRNNAVGEVTLEEVDQFGGEHNGLHVPIALEAFTAKAVNWIGVRIATVKPRPNGVTGHQRVGVARDDLTRDYRRRALIRVVRAASLSTKWIHSMLAMR